jgi:hypothetical protein
MTRSRPEDLLIIIIIRRAPRPCGACPTQPYKCGQNLKINVKVKTIAVLTLKY